MPLYPPLDLVGHASLQNFSLNARCRDFCSLCDLRLRLLISQNQIDQVEAQLSSFLPPLLLANNSSITPRLCPTETITDDDIRAQLVRFVFLPLGRISDAKLFLPLATHSQYQSLLEDIAFHETSTASKESPINSEKHLKQSPGSLALYGSTLEAVAKLSKERLFAGLAAVFAFLVVWQVHLG